MGPSATENLSMVPVNSAQSEQSQQTQAGSVQTGADLLNTMTQQRLNSLYQTQDKLNSEIMKVSGAAATPVPVSGTSAVNPPGQHQWSGIPQDNRTTYSASGSKKLGIANAIRGVANVVGAMETKSQNEKNKSLSVDIERLLEANQGMQTAQQSGDTATAKKNEELMNAILSDPKKRKSISKAFDINFVDPSQNNKPEHAALKSAVESYSQQFQKQIPSQMQPNVQAQQKLGQLQETGKLIDSQIKAATSDKTAEAYIKATQNQEKIDLDRQKESDKVSHWDQQAKDRSTQFNQKLSQQLEIAKGNQNVKLSVADIQANAHLTGIDRTIQGRIKYANSIGATDVQMARVITSALKTYDDEQKNFPTEMLQWQTLYNNPAASPQDKENAQYHINLINTKKEYLAKQTEALQKQLTVLTGNLNMGEQDGSGSNSNNNSNNDPTIPPVLNPNGARPEKPSGEKSDKPGPQASSQPVVNQTGPKQDTIDITKLTPEQFAELKKQLAAQMAQF